MSEPRAQHEWEARLVVDSSGEEETIAQAADEGRACKGGEWFALSGELGAGKTRYVRGLAQGLGCDPGAVSSPTYVLMNEYIPVEKGRPRLLHIDAYRITSADALDAIGLDAALQTKPGEPPPVVAVEWPERLCDRLPERCVHVRIEHVGPERRRITLSARGVS